MKDIIEKGSKMFAGSKWLVISDGVMLLIVLAVAGAFFFEFQSISSLKNNMASSTEVLGQRITNLEAVLATTTNNLSQQLQNQNSDIQATISDISGTVGTLQKLSKTDKELLQKYSKVYFLSDNYVPMSLSNINPEYLFDSTKLLQFHTSALPFLENMMSHAMRAGVSIRIVSAYRSFGTQSSLKSGYLVTYGSGANQFSADQGYSEHQLGTAVDITTEGKVAMLTIDFDKTPTYAWLANNAYRYGFILSYPKGNAYYQYEPWHWRFVGVELATKLHDDGLNFSDMDQREIDTYLANIFD